MTTAEIQTWARIANLNGAYAGKRVRITREGNGKLEYLACIDGKSGFTDDVKYATVYNYTTDEVGTQLGQVEERYGVEWSVEEVE